MTNANNDIKLSNITDSLECLGNANTGAALDLLTKEKQNIDEVMYAKDVKETQPVKLECHKSEKLVTLMSDKTLMCTLKTDDPMSSNDNRICFQEIVSVASTDIYIGSSCGVTGSVFMPNGQLVVCEGNSDCSVKVFSKDFKLKSEEIINDVWDVAVVSENEVIVSQCVDKSLQYLSISGDIALGKTIPVGTMCWGVEYKNDKIYVTCHESRGKMGIVKVLTMNGDTLNTINVSQGHPYNLAVNSAGDRIVVSTDNEVQCFDITGTKLYTHSDSQLSGRRGLLFDSYNNIMLCGRLSHNLQVVNSDGTKQTIISTSEDGIDKPYCLAYRPSDKTLVIGQYEALLVFKLN